MFITAWISDEKIILTILFNFCLIWGFSGKHSRNVAYFVFLLCFDDILLLIITILKKPKFHNFVSPNKIILLCPKIYKLYSQLYYLTIGCAKTSGK